MDFFRLVSFGICYCIWLLLGYLRKQFLEEYVEEIERGDYQRVERYKEFVCDLFVIFFNFLIIGLLIGCGRVFYIWLMLINK